MKKNSTYFIVMAITFMLNPLILKASEDVTPKLKDITTDFPEDKSAYSLLNEGYKTLLESQKSKRKWVYKMLPILAAGNVLRENGDITIMRYSPAFYTLGLMKIEDGRIEEGVKDLKMAITLSKLRPQERKVYLWASYAYANALSDLKKYAKASKKYLYLFSNLNEKERATWNMRIKSKLSQIVNLIELPWWKACALTLSNEEKDKEKSFDIFNECMTKISREEFEKYSISIVKMINMIEFLANNNLSSNAQILMSRLHFFQRKDSVSTFNGEPIIPMNEMELAYKYACMADTGKSRVAKSLKGEIALEIGIYLLNNAPLENKDEIKKWFKISSETGYTPGKGKYSIFCLNTDRGESSESEMKEHLERLHEVADSGDLRAQELLCCIYVAGYTFDSGFYVGPNFLKAYEYSSKEPCTLEMALAKGMILSVGVKNETKNNKSSWAIKPNVILAKKILGVVFFENEELVYVRLIEFFKSKYVPQEMKEFLFKFIEEIYSKERPHIFIKRCYGVLLLFKGEHSQSVKVLESISKDDNNPNGYFELANAYLGEDGLPKDLSKSITYCIKGLRFFTEEQLKDVQGTPARECIENIYKRLKSNPDQDKKINFLLELFNKSLNQYGLRVIAFNPNKEN